MCYRRILHKNDPIKVPATFTRQEILQLLGTMVDDLRYKAIFLPTYGSRLHLSDVMKLRIKVADNHISKRAIQYAFKKFHKKSNIKMYATLWRTMRYLRIAMTVVMKTESPLDKLKLVKTDACNSLTN